MHNNVAGMLCSELGRDIDRVLIVPIALQPGGSVQCANILQRFNPDCATKESSGFCTIIRDVSSPVSRFAETGVDLTDLQVHVCCMHATDSSSSVSACDMNMWKPGSDFDSNTSRTRMPGKQGLSCYCGITDTILKQ